MKIGLIKSKNNVTYLKESFVMIKMIKMVNNENKT